MNPRLLDQLRSAALLFAFVALSMESSVFAQTAPPNIQYTNKTFDLGLRGELRINPSTRALEIQINLGNYAGRAGLNLPVILNYSSKVWRVDYNFYNPGQFTSSGNPIGNGFTGVVARYAEHSAAGWTSSLGFPFFDNAPIQYYNYGGGPVPDVNSCGLQGCYLIDRLLIWMPDGSEHELRSSDQPITPGTTPSDNLYAVDGTRIRYQRSTQTLFMPDGSRYLMAGNQYVDRSGNTLTFDSANNRWLDTMGRAISLSFGGAYSLPGVGGSSLNYTFVWKSLGAPGVMTIAQPLQYTADSACPPGNGSFSPHLFESDPVTSHTCIINAGSIFNPVVLYQIILPNQRAYTFTYNVYGEIDKVQLPTGGYERYEYQQGGAITISTAPYSQANRAVTKRFVSASGTGSDETQWQYAGNGNLVSVTAPDNSLVEHYQYTDSVVSPSSWGYSVDGARAGRTYDERYFSAPDSGGVRQMLRRKLTEWTMSGASTSSQQPGVQSANRNVRMTKEIEILLDNGTSALAKTTTYGYDTTYQFDVGVDQTSISEYDYVSVDQNTAQGGSINQIPTGVLLRTTQTTYLTGNANYRNRNILGLPTSTTVYNSGSGIVAQSTITYDEASYPLLTYGSVTGWIDPQTSYRGNPTTTSRWLDYPTSTWISTHAQFDQCGSVRYVWDARDITLTNPTQIEYSSAYAYAYPTVTRTPVPDSTGQYGSTSALVTSAAYDFNTGLVTSTTDANGKTTSFEYNDPLDRLTRANLPDGGRTTHAYVDAHQCGAFVETRTLLDNGGRETDSWQFFDGLGRPYLAEQLDNQDPANPFLRVDTQYDSIGRVWRVSSPYRSPGCTSAVNPSGRWTQTTFDALSRPTQALTTADNAAVTTAYRGNAVTITDQAGKQRRSLTDALGRLVRVDEQVCQGQPCTPTLGSVDNPAQPTSYLYDVLGNLRKVTQGAQQRFFMYDSLSRLIRAKNPEQDINSVLNLSDSITGNSGWSFGYSYDNNGNLTSRIDARNITTTYAYDALNRNYSTNYSDGTPTVYRYYDSAVNGRGRLSWQQAVGVFANTFDSYDAMGRLTQYHQRFWTGGTWGQSFMVARSYDYAGNLISQTMPSGHTESYGYDIAGRINSFSGNLGDGVSRTYATGISYSEFGGLQQEQFGTLTPLYHKLHYNSRGQLYDIRLSSYSLQTSEWNWNRGALLNYYSANYGWGTSGTDNNGNVTRQQHYIPTNDSLTTYNFFEDTFAYDSLNRLKTITEVPATQAGYGGPSLLQTYNYDRFGNRTIDQVNTSSTFPHPAFNVDANTNRLAAPAGWTMSYDAAGNLTYDNYSGEGTRTYDAENRMKQAWANNQWQTYTYDADGQRVKRLVNGNETWQVYGMNGELLAEYLPGAAPFVPSKEYGYRGGELLVTMSSGDDLRLLKFLHKLYIGALGRSPNSTEQQQGMDSLTAAGVQSQDALLSTSRSIAQTLFNSTEYAQRNRTDAQFVTDLYWSYLQRAPDAGGYQAWLNAVPTSGRAAVRDGFAYSGEFAGLVSRIYGVSTDDNQRTLLFVYKMYSGALGRDPSSSELSAGIARLNTKAAQGQSQVIAEAQALAREIFTSTEYTNRNRSNRDFVMDLYLATVQRAPDTAGWDAWTNAVASSGRPMVREGFLSSGEFQYLAGTLYREEFWLVNDHLGTPRMIVDKSGSLAGVKRHDYLPFGEELFAGTGGRTTAQGYLADNVRQKFTQKERDIETGLDFFEARYFASMQGRFTSIDPYNIVLETQFATDAKKAQSQFTTYLSNPQRWARYTYALNNPLLYTDPHGENVTIYYRPPNPNIENDYGHILIYVRNDETGESAYYDYIATGTYNNFGDTKLSGVDQDRINAHASITIETTASQEQAILDGIKAAQQSSPDYSVSASQVLTHSETTCTSNAIKLLSLGGINVGPTLMPQTPTAVWQSAFEQYGDKNANRTTIPDPQPRFPDRRREIIQGYDTRPQVNPGKEYGHDPRGQARVLDSHATNNYTMIFRGGKRVQ
jgi:RHS repeat-associated protein